MDRHMDDLANNHSNDLAGFIIPKLRLCCVGICCEKHTEIAKTVGLSAK